MTQSNTGSVGTIAETMDRHVLYQKSVQDPATEIEFLVDKYKELKGKSPVLLREDFCGTAFLATEWCKSNSKFRAVGVDLCEDTLQWGKEKNIDAAGSEVSSRVQVFKENVLEYYDKNNLADIICAFNFSYNILMTRSMLVDYFKNARRGLADDGIFVLDIFGGTEAYDTAEEDREVDDESFSYIWEQAKFNPITHEMQCYIHFEFEDGSRINKAFSYEWRLRTIPELIESLEEAGFSKVRCFWEKFEESTDEDEEEEADLFLCPHCDNEIDISDDDEDELLVETGIYYETKEIENQDSWISYIVAEK